ncbi:hypothetical protein [Chryseobacterium turcicum]|uniref:Uncharacterized protein n=1 Tax=Chryseobacterium turcicum TaxID=2898076 RepID=A0A9Q3YVF1_9FLAO|nr:hypothetical protein [Chryseobacterium turcicum]MCD1116818.1 hypothetical protein [Chryseobacterium turcicum]
MLLCCTGDTLDSPNRNAFPKTKTELLSYPQGNEMFLIAREALKNVGKWDSTYKQLYDKNPNKFCRGYGIFQYDLQHFKTNPNYFLKKEWRNFEKCLNLLLQELIAAQQRTPRLKNKTILNSTEKVFTAIAYNRGSVNMDGDFKQGHKNISTGKYYGELISHSLKSHYFSFNKNSGFFFF